MTPGDAYPSDVAFSASVKAVQARKGSRAAYARMESTRGWRTLVTPELAGFIAQQESFFLATANAAGQPYIQHRGGPAGFLRVLDPRTLAFADFSGNRQFITQGNLAENPKVHLFLIDYRERRRIKIWGEARVVEDHTHLAVSLVPDGSTVRVEQAIVIAVHAWDENCSRHIPERLDAQEARAALAERDARILELEREIARLARERGASRSDEGKWSG